MDMPAQAPSQLSSLYSTHLRLLSAPLDIPLCSGVMFVILGLVDAVISIFRPVIFACFRPSGTIGSGFGFIC
ncbi:hypothetical protein BDW66DRAFT_136224, partial [Aspergillus desertorum]